MTDAAKLGFTKQRTVVLQVIRESDVHLTANEVFERSRRLLPGISFATVYNSLKYLKSQRQIGEIRFGNDATRYDRRLTRHDHAMCSGCGRLVDLDLPVVPEILKKAALMSKFEPESIEFILRGKCAECSQSQNKVGQ
ncbi:MAG TPA: transcriptional repressor [Pyrinomonadaceae bacterium]|jgi:Fe2+ or Zn2+ uptake regulation protein|nr:transcriptional repressor [Pyrinomonadaceae bacterium]